MMKRTLTIQPYGAVEFFTATLQGCTIKYDEKNFNNTTLRGCTKERIQYPVIELVEITGLLNFLPQPYGVA
jgi:hypothetical protein